MNNIILSSLFSFFLHGVVLACCVAVPAQKLVPLFQAGNSSLTLTALSVSAPDNHESTPDIKTGRQNDLPDESEMEDEAEDSPDDLPAIAEKKSSTAAQPKPQNRKMPVDADACAKGVSGFLAESAGIRPYYPLGARLRGEEGVVKVEVCVSSSGQVLDCAVAKSSGYSALDEAALKAVKCARFISAKLLSIKNDNRTVLTFRFDLVD